MSTTSYWTSLAIHRACDLRLSARRYTGGDLVTDAPIANDDPGQGEPLVAPFAGWVVHPDWADRVISRAYDNLSPVQRQALVASNPYSYMNVTRSRDDLFDNADLSHEDLVTQGAAALTRLLNARAFVPTGRPALYLYRLTHKQGMQTGVVCTVPVRGFDDGRIRIHERVHDERGRPTHRSSSRRGRHFQSGGHGRSVNY